MGSDQSSRFRLYAAKCQELLEDPDVRFAGIIDDRGQLVSGGFKESITPYEADETRLHAFMEFVSRITIRKEYDQSLGPINYLAARRNRVVLMSFPFPITKIVLLVSAEPNVDIEDLASRVTKAFAGVT